MDQNWSNERMDIRVMDGQMDGRTDGRSFPMNGEQY